MTTSSETPMLRYQPYSPTSEWLGKEDELLTATLHRAAYRVVDQSVDVTTPGSLRGDLLHDLTSNGGAQAQHPAKELVRLHHARPAETVLGWARKRGEVGDDADPVLLADLTCAAIRHQVLVADGQADAAFVESPRQIGGAQ
ncbi:TetR-like C-terminal domain-containing protein [Streptomyces caniscabiei]|uniref:TetR-like C-terminal domain-containing protein n=1 Tax=Streptomyces caniscabiei TaxID=2746961 RepID=UPI00117C27F3|nr:TetR-like C-terminal domain-containing protein [Streptomyces caniscabiei]